MYSQSVVVGSATEPLLRLTNISKSFGTLSVLQQLSFDIYPGQVVGLAGRSGAGKSTLVELIAGIYAPDEGQAQYAGHRLKWPFNARMLGIETIHQKPALFETLDICSNIFTGIERAVPGILKGRFLLSTCGMEQKATAVLAELGLEVGSLREKVANLTAEQRQVVAIARAMVLPARLMIVDDPTPLHNYLHRQRLLLLVRTWQQQGRAVLFSSQNLDQLFAIADRIIVLRDGCLVLNVRTDETNHEEVVNAVVGTTERHHLTPLLWALDSYNDARTSAESLSRNQKLLTQDLVERDALNQQLMDQLNEQVKALDRANLALQDAQRRLLTEREQERKFLARELHDQTIQDLLAISYRLEQTETDQAETSAVRDELADMREDIRGLIDDLRQVCSDLRPPTIDSLGLGAAVRSYTGDWSRKTRVRVTLDLDTNLGRLPSAIELSVFRIIQESLRNVRKHSAASAVKICLNDLSPRMLMVSISDNGRGLAQDFDLSALSAENHYGLLGVTERVALLGGRASFQNQDGGGLMIRVEIPHPRVDV